jgi:spermidine dehydrogenase
MALLARTSYADYLSKYCHLSKGALTYFQSFTHDLFGVGIDAVPAGDCVPLELPGFAGLGLDDSPAPGMGRSAILHSNASRTSSTPRRQLTIARLVRARPGASPPAMSGARVNYATSTAPPRVRVRLSSTVVHARNAATGVEVTYVRNGRAER